MKAVLGFLVNYWKEVALVVLLFVVSFFWWQDHRGLVGAYDASVESYELRIRDLKESYKRETERKQEALEEYKEKVEILETEYSEYRSAIVEVKADRVRELVRLRMENPHQLIAEMEERFHFEYIE
tara:strand:- start:165 stop:542 length:378 start_codon:yes stop_codon:yes gene_type:complete